MIATLSHPGPASARRWAAAPCHAQPIEVTLPVADTLAQSAALALAGFDGGWIEIRDETLANLDFVIPGPDPTGAHAAWYAGPHRMGAGRIDHLGMHVGLKDGAPWIHGHGAFDAPGWRGPGFGHILPHESRLARPIRARGWGIRGARLAVAADPETHFPLFQPADLGGGGGAALITTRPNQDMGAAIAAAAAAVGITRGRILGLGSLVHPRLQGQAPIDSYATEILLTQGFLDKGLARIEAEVVTLDATLHKGWLTPGENGVCITAEVLVLAS
ncbi:MAG: hypothetical protein H6900_03640 [Rhodobacter sp.]|uniref:hypothetical protein n=1 Tax=Pararhodobacter sp. TaxID=2127056 RepID=UPI001D4F411E|nr:hypothetical protein [Pararhodobacter sp.]MCB1345062.1 hypothetical protein [Paracoccaceae bacterium]MCC0072364.1 hypothetical protein [Rhodobacter sp.]HPD91895.1 hypothetical protein [Pararhodobacter sp.]